MNTKTNALSRAIETYEDRTDLKVLTVRLSSDARSRLSRLEEKLGSKRKAIEIALAYFERTLDGRNGGIEGGGMR